MNNKINISSNWSELSYDFALTDNKHLGRVTVLLQAETLSSMLRKYPYSFDRIQKKEIVQPLTEYLKENLMSQSYRTGPPECTNTLIGKRITSRSYKGLANPNWSIGYLQTIRLL